MKENIQIWRDENGIPHVEAPSEPDLFFGMGFVHATDRGLQMLLTRIAGQGRISGVLDSSDPAEALRELLGTSAPAPRAIA